MSTKDTENRANKRGQICEPNLISFPAIDDLERRANIGVHGDNDADGHGGDHGGPENSWKQKNTEWPDEDLQQGLINIDTIEHPERLPVRRFVPTNPERLV